MWVIMVNWDSFWQSWDKYLFAVSLPSAPEKTCLHGKIHTRSPECLSCADTTSIPGSVSQHALVFESTWSLKARCQETSHSNPPQRIRNTMSLAAAQKCFHPALKAFWAQSSGQPICFSEETVVKLQSPHCGIIIKKICQIHWHSPDLAERWSGGRLLTPPSEWRAACGEEAVPLGLESVVIAAPPVHSGARTTAWQTAITWAGSVFIWSHKSKLRLGLALFGSCLIRSEL